MTAHSSLTGKRICVVHPYPSASVLGRLKREGCLLVLFGGACPPELLEAHVPLQLTDYAEVEEAAARYHERAPFDAVLPLYEGATALTARIARRLQLRGSPVEAAELSRNKYLTYERLRAAGVTMPPSLAVEPLQREVARIRAEIGYPAIIKLSDSMNSQGVTRVDDDDQCTAALRDHANLLERPKDFDSRQDRNRIAYGQGGVRLVAQPFYAGREVGVDLLFDESAHRIMGVFEKELSNGPYFPEHMSVSPTSLSPDELVTVCELAVAAIRALDLRIGAAHVEIRFSARGPAVLEVGARPGGGLTIEAVDSLTGRHPVVELVRLLLGGVLPEVETKLQRGVLYGGIVHTRSGRLARVSGVKEASALPGVSKFFQLQREGDLVFAMPDSAQPHFCYYLIEGSSRAEVLATHHQIGRTIELDVVAP